MDSEDKFWAFMGCMCGGGFISYASVLYGNQLTFGLGLLMLFGSFGIIFSA